MSKDVLELENAGEILKLYAGNEKDEIVCITSFNEVNQDAARVKMKLVVTSEPTGTNILVRSSEVIGETDLMVDNTKEFEQVNKGRRDDIEKLKIEVEKRKAEYLKVFESKGFRVLLGAWIV